ncbi:Chromosomal replication initiator protein DnaA [Phycisphaerae bacterium RAS1]|nr:Chromosomal replication initiator protein DnaA [Phycisphaerae bacterium RAS1]
MRAVADLLELPNVTIKNIRRGSTIITLELTPKQAERLLWAVKAGDFARFGVHDARLVVESVRSSKERVIESGRQMKPPLPSSALAPEALRSETGVAEKVRTIRERFSSLIGEERYRTWFGDTADFELRGRRLRVTIDNAFVSGWISANFMKELVVVTRDVIGAEPSIDLRVASHSDSVTGREAGGDLPTTRRARGTPEGGRTAAALRGDLETFVVGPSNELAYSAAMELARAPGGIFRLVVVHGKSGVGKTHLLQGVCNAVRGQHPRLNWSYISGEQFTNEFVYAVKSGQIDLFRARFRKLDLLAIDDIQFLANRKATQEEFLHTMRAIDVTGKATVISSDRHPRTIAELSERLINLIMGGVVVQIDAPDFATRREILRRRAAAIHAELPEDVLEFLAHRVTQNVRELEGALYKLMAMASLHRQKINLDMAGKVVEDYGDDVPRAPEPTEIAQLVAARFGVTQEALHSQSRDRTVTLARSLAMYLIRKHTQLSYPEIGRRMGRKNHATVLMAIRRLRTLVENNDALSWTTLAGKRELPIRVLLKEIEDVFATR